MSEQLIKRMREQRMKWVDIAGQPGKRVRIIRPTETEVGQYLSKGRELVVGLEEVKRFAVDWQGYTQADLLGASIGSADAVPFHPDLWAEVVSDQAKWVRQLAQDLLDLVVAHGSAVAEDAKN